MADDARRAGVAAALAGSAILFCATFVDEAAYRWARQADPGVVRFWRAATGIGDSGWMLGSTAFVALTAWTEARRASGRLAASLDLVALRAAFCFAAVAILGVAASLAKLAIGRARPKLHDVAGSFDFTPLAFDFKMNSFPSGHATTLFAFATALALIAPRWRVALYTVAAWGAFSRVAASAHYVSDAVAGAALGHYGTLWLADRAAARRLAFRRDCVARAPRSAAAGVAHLVRRAGLPAPPALLAAAARGGLVRRSDGAAA